MGGTGAAPDPARLVVRARGQALAAAPLKLFRYDSQRPSAGCSSGEVAGGLAARQ